MFIKKERDWGDEELRKLMVEEDIQVLFIAGNNHATGSIL
jgi:hypothetical protein